MINIKRLYILISLIVILLILAILISTDTLIPNIDKKIMEVIYKIRGIKTSFGYYFFRFITEFGYFYLIIVIALILGFVWKFNDKFIFLGIFTIVTSLINSFLKLIVNRERPDVLFRFVSEKTTSFPSGHSVTAFFFYGMIMYYVLNSDAKPVIKKLVKFFCPTIIILVGLSRVYLGVHYPSDVLGGYLLGLIMILVVSTYTKNFKIRK